LNLFSDNVVTEVYALITDEYRGSSNEFSDFMLAFAAKGAIQQFAVVIALCEIIV
jgi:hypothetical protein